MERLTGDNCLNHSVMREENIPYPSQRQTGDRIERSSLFSYACGRCGRCCRGTLIQTNPYEIAVLAQHLGTSTTAIIANYLDGVHLRHQGDGRCIFLSDQGCEVHSARPFVCRLYPLGWYGIVAPTGTPTEIVQLLNAQINKILAMPDVVQTLRAAGFEPGKNTVEEFATIIRDDYVRWGKVVQMSKKMNP